MVATSRYEVDELGFDVPEGFVDESMNAFFPIDPDSAGLSVVITREPRSAGTLGEQAVAILKSAEGKIPTLRLLGHRERTLQLVPAYEARTHVAGPKGAPSYQRQLFVSWYGTLLTFVVTTPRARSHECDAILEQIAASLRLKRRA
jgi:hypothetical protein